MKTRSLDLLSIWAAQAPIWCTAQAMPMTSDQYILWTLFISSRHFLDHHYTFQIIYTLFRSFGHFSDHLDNFQIIGTLWRSSGHFSDYPDTFQIIWTLCRSSRYFLGQRNTLQIIRTLWLPSFADNQQMFYTIWLLLRPIGYFWDHSKIISKYSRHSAGRPAKTFQSALWSFIQLLPSFDHGLKRRQIFEGVAHTTKAHWDRLKSG